MQGVVTSLEVLSDMIIPSVNNGLITFYSPSGEEARCLFPQSSWTKVQRAESFVESFRSSQGLRVLLLHSVPLCHPFERAFVLVGPCTLIILAYLICCFESHVPRWSSCVMLIFD
jgi:hypothetical protein